MDVLCSKEINKEKLELTSEFSIFFTFQQGLATSWQHVGFQFLCQHLDRGSKVLLGFLEEKLKISMHVNFGLICTFLDQMQIHLDKQSKRLDIQISKKWIYLLNNDKQWKRKFENVPPFFELVRTSNHALQEMIEINSWKNWSKLF